MNSSMFNKHIYKPNMNKENFWKDFITSIRKSSVEPVLVAFAFFCIGIVLERVRQIWMIIIDLIELFLFDEKVSLTRI